MLLQTARDPVQRWKWVDYSAFDAKATWDLYHSLREKLAANEAELDIELRPGITGAAQLQHSALASRSNGGAVNGGRNGSNGTGKQVSKQRSKRNSQNGAGNGTEEELQDCVAYSQWDLYQDVIRPFGRLLTDMEDVRS